MKIALVFPPYSHKVFSENLSTVDEEFCLAPPIILAYVAAILEKSGHKVMLLDMRALGLSKEQALERLMAFGPDMLGFRAESYHFNEALEWIGYLEGHLGVPVISGGVNFDLYPYETMSRSEIDYGIIGEAIESLPALLSAIEDKRTLRDIPGAAYKEGANVIVNEPRRDYADFDSYPFPARHLLPNEKYYSFISQLKNFTIMLASTGCPFECVFCAIHPNTKYRLRSPESVVDEIEVCCRDFGVREIDFFDAVFFSGRPRMLKIFSEIKKRRLKVEWSCRSRVDVVDEELLKEAKDAGCRQIYYGIESAEPDVLSSIKKDITHERVRQAIKWSNKYGIRAMGFFMVGNQQDTAQSVRRTIEFSKSLGLDFIQVCRTIAKPGSELDRIMIDRLGIDYWREHVSGRSIRRRLPTPWSGLSEAETASLTKEFYVKFYLRPSIIRDRIMQLKSLSEFVRYVKVAFKLIMRRSELPFHVITDTSESEVFLRQAGKYLQQARLLKSAVVIPTYNERENIEKISGSVIDVLPNAHIVIVDDASGDGTGAVADRLAKENSRIHVIHRNGSRGLGLAYKDGFKFVLNKLDVDYIFQMDADLSHNPQYLPVFLHYAMEYDLVTGSRFMKTVSIKNRTVWRNIVSKTTKWFMNVLTGIGLTDVTTGFKCFRRKLLEKIDFKKISSRGYAFQIEVSCAARKAKARIKEIPVLFVERTAGKSKLSYRIMLEGVITVFKLAFLKRIKYGL